MERGKKNENEDRPRTKEARERGIKKLTCTVRAEREIFGELHKLQQGEEDQERQLGTSKEL